MYVKDIKKDFYNVLCGNRVLVLVHLDADALCAFRILQALLQTDNAAYTVESVGGEEELKEAYGRHREDVRCTVLINCGGVIDLVELLQPADGAILFVLDAHRPTDVCNVYSDGQIQLLGPADEGVPEFDDIFRDDDTEGEEDGEEERQGDADEEGRTETTVEERRAKRRQRVAWEQNRDTLMFNYTQFSYYGQSAAVCMLELARALSKDSWETLWWACVGATEQLILDKVETAQYIIDAGVLQTHVARLRLSKGDSQSAITLEQDARLALYRHWSLEEALKFSPLSWARLKLWGARGAVRLQRLLADMGLPLRQARQPHASMELSLRKELLPSLERLADQYGLRELLYPAFCMRGGRLCASDYVYSLLALLEEPQGFRKALLALSPQEGMGEFRAGQEAAKLRLRGAGRAVEGILRGRLLQSAGPFLHAKLVEGAGGPRWLGLLARWLQRGAPAARPLLLAAPDVHNTTTILLGVPPLSDDSTRNLFGKAFEQAALQSRVPATPSGLEPATVSLPTDQLGRFLDALTALLT